MDWIIGFLTGFLVGASAALWWMSRKIRGVNERLKVVVALQEQERRRAL